MLATLIADLSRFPQPGLTWQEAPRDWRRILAAILDEQGAWAVIDYRFRRWARGRSGVSRPPLRILAFASRKVIETLTGIQIAASAEFGPGLYIGHLGTTIVGGDAKAGENCSLSQGVTLGEHAGGNPTLGDRVYIAPGAKVFGPITVGDDVRIGANAVVNRDVPAGVTAVGVPARWAEAPSPGRA